MDLVSFYYTTPKQEVDVNSFTLLCEQLAEVACDSQPLSQRVLSHRIISVFFKENLPHCVSDIPSNYNNELFSSSVQTRYHVWLRDSEMQLIPDSASIRFLKKSPQALRFSAVGRSTFVSRFIDEFARSSSLGGEYVSAYSQIANRVLN